MPHAVSAMVASFGGVSSNPIKAAADGDFLAVLCSNPFLKCSAGYVGVSDGWQDLHEHNRMAWAYTRAEDGNVALTAVGGVVNQDAKWTYQYANSAIVPADTYGGVNTNNGRVTYTASLP